MKNLKLWALLIASCISFGFAGSANAEVGYIDYQRVLENYPAAQNAIKELDAKGLELQQYILEQEKQYKSLSTPLQKQNFDTQTATAIKQKQDALAKLQRDREDQVLSKIQEVAKSIMVSQRLDAVLSDQVVFVGGVDITDQVIQQLKQGK